MVKSTITFFERQFPSANMVLIHDEKPVLIDTGFGSDVKETEKLILDAGITPETLQFIVNTHYHSDHVGGNHYFQQQYQTPVAAHKWEADLINAMDVDACSSEWLDQPVEQYTVNRKLSNDDEINTGSRTFKVIHTPGHTLGHISLYEPDEQVLICGDLFHNGDIGWINPFKEGAGAIYRSLESLEQLSKLPIRVAYSGHGPQIDNPMVAIDAAKSRFEKWLTSPEKVAWHGLKRIFAFTLIMKNGLARQEVDGYLLGCGWFQDFARHVFQRQPEEFISVLLDEMIRSGAAIWVQERLIATADFKAPASEWLQQNNMPRNWLNQGAVK